MKLRHDVFTQEDQEIEILEGNYPEDVPVIEKNQETANEMLRIWKKYIPHEDEFEPSPLKKNLMIFLFHRCFNADIKEWKRFVFYTSKSGMLMSERTRYRASLNWILSKSCIVKIKRGRYHSLQDVIANIKCTSK